LTDEAKMIARSTSAALLHALPAILLMTVVLWTFVLTGSLGVAMCQYGSPFCDNPFLVTVAAGLAACWGAFVSVR